MDGITGQRPPINNQYDMIFTDKADNSEMDKMDFMALMIAEMQNQDFTDPMDNSEMVAQMAQFSNMQMMQEMAGYSQTNYAVSLVGKTVTASRFTVSGNLDTVTGVVDKVSLVDGEYIAYIGDKQYFMTQIMEISSPRPEGESAVDPTNFKLEANDITAESATIEWEVPTEDGLEAKKLKYTVYYSTEEEFSTVEDVEKGTRVGAKEEKDITSANIEDLDPKTQYYANVVVTDENGIKSVYKQIEFTTSEEE